MPWCIVSDGNPSTATFPTWLDASYVLHTFGRPGAEAEIIYAAGDS